MFLGIDLGASGVSLLLSADMHRIAVAASDGRSVRQIFSVLPKKPPTTRETACFPPALGGKFSGRRSASATERPAVLDIQLT